VTTGQRKFGGPPPGWEGEPPSKGCEVRFCIEKSSLFFLGGGYFFFILFVVVVAKPSRINHHMSSNVETWQMWCFVL
jgi:hypothetical protein